LETPGIVYGLALRTDVEKCIQSIQ